MRMYFVNCVDLKYEPFTFYKNDHVTLYKHKAL